MNGYLMQEGEWTPGEDLFLESLSPENKFGVVFEDDGDTAYFYALEMDQEGTGMRILDALHIDERSGDPEADESEEGAAPGGEEMIATEGVGPGNGAAAAKPSRLQIVWSHDWMKSALVIDGYCHALFDFEGQGGYNINEFPPPNKIWTQGDRKLTDELMRRLF
jgi:hypothetical protein